MRLPEPLLKGRLLRRYKRFLADIELAGGKPVTAHCANPGSMIGLKDPGMEVWVSQSDNPKRKLKYSWELAACGEALVGINTNYPNAIVEEAVLAGKISPLADYGSLRREVKYGENSRIDILLESPGLPAAYVEVKNVHLMREQGVAEFPDAVTERGAKHLRELSGMVKAGFRAVMIYLVQYPTAKSFRLADDIDPNYAESFRKAMECGVEAYAYVCDISLAEIKVRERIPFEEPAGPNH